MCCMLMTLVYTCKLVTVTSMPYVLNIELAALVEWLNAKKTHSKC